MNIGGYTFSHVCTIQPERSVNNVVTAFYPHREYQTALPLLPYGEGPFCRFRIPDNVPTAGVYALTIDRNIVYYIGETVNLSQRFNGRAHYGAYGIIQPRACFQGGQATNLRINSNLYHAAMADITIDLWFYQTGNYKAVEADIIPLIKPKWNRLGVTTELRPNEITQRNNTPLVQTSQLTLPRTSTCRNEILICVREMIQRTGKNEFTVEDIKRAMRAKGTSYKDTTIQIHVTSKMCLDGPNLHHTRYDDFQQLGKDRYRLKSLT